MAKSSKKSKEATAPEGSPTAPGMESSNGHSAVEPAKPAPAKKATKSAGSAKSPGKTKGTAVKKVQCHAQTADEKDRQKQWRFVGHGRSDPPSGLFHLGMAHAQRRRRRLRARLAGSGPAVAGRSRTRLTSAVDASLCEARRLSPNQNGVPRFAERSVYTVSNSGKQDFTFSIRRLIVKGFARKPRTRASLSNSCARSSEP